MTRDRQESYRDPDHYESDEDEDYPLLRPGRGSGGPFSKVAAFFTPSHRLTKPNHAAVIRNIAYAVLAILVLAPIIWIFHWLVSDHRPLYDRVPLGEAERILLGVPQNGTVRKWSKYYASGAHLAGRNMSQAEWTRDKWESYGVKSELVPYDVLLNYPVSHSLEMRDISGRTTFKAKLREDVVKGDPNSELRNEVPTFHGYSANGSAAGRLVYANYGTESDYRKLRDLGIDLTGKIVIARYGKNFRGLKVKGAQEAGAIGVLIYTDPGDDSVTEDEGQAVYPNGGARNPSSVQRGSVMFLSTGAGDPSTPGYPSLPGKETKRVEHEMSDVLPKIPSLPISYEDAIPLLQSLNGIGPVVKGWAGGLEKWDVEYAVGPSKAAVHMVNEVEWKIERIYNVIGTINGTLDDVVILGNHRDSWPAGGAGDPASGSAAMIEVVRSFGKLLETGWSPLRTIVFASWDAEEYGLVGSTEWVEQYSPWLAKNAVAYLNVDMAATGPDFEASASPSLNKLVLEATKDVRYPSKVVEHRKNPARKKHKPPKVKEGKTVYERWAKRTRKEGGHGPEIGILGSGSDFTPFLEHAGIPSVDFSFAGHKGGPVYHYHSVYDSFHWMDTYGDPEWTHHTLTAKLWGLMGLRLASSAIIPFNVTEYAGAIEGYVVGLGKEYHEFDFSEMKGAAKELKRAAVKLDAEAVKVSNKMKTAMRMSHRRKIALLRSAKDINEKYRKFERAFLDKKGLEDREWYKHVVFAPGLETGYEGETFPSLREALREGRVEVAEKWERRVAKAVKKAARVIE
ncbi:hypothetical protein YB2330_005918 [Saitoella coloradoensis]